MSPWSDGREAQSASCRSRAVRRGGVKGIGLVGAVGALRDAGYALERISGTSAGSLVGAVVAAATQAGGISADQLLELAVTHYVT